MTLMFVAEIRKLPVCRFRSSPFDVCMETATP